MMEDFGSITEVIRAKERELQKIQDLRFAQLEKTIEDRDQLLLDCSRQYQQLKDDFQYNLRLIEARDKEIGRLEGIIEKQGKEKEELEQQVRNLLTRIDSMQHKEKELIDKLDQDKAMNKRIFAEMKTAIESMQWSADEEARVKDHEIGSLKKEIQALHRAKDEAVELQRRDLTSAFEQIIQQREEYIAQKESELAHQVSLLDQKFERLQTENMTAKASLRELKVVHERNVEEICRLEELNRQLTYQVEDTVKAKDTSEDHLKRQVGLLQGDLQRLSDQRSKEKQELEALVEKLKNDAVREREFRAIIEKRLEDFQANASSESFALHEEQLSLRKRIHALEQDLDETKTEKEQTIVKLGNKRIEVETLHTKQRMLQEEIDAAHERNKRLEGNYQLLETTLTQVQKEFDHYRLIVEKEHKLSHETSRDEIAEIKRVAAQNLQRMREDRDEEVLKLKAHYEEKLQDKQKEIAELMDLRGDKFIQGNKEKDAEIAQLKLSLQAKEKALQDERMDAEALRLRLKAQEAQLISTAQEMKQLKSAGSRATGALHRPTVSNSLAATPGGGLEAPLTNDTRGELSLLLDLPSPMMSEDLNFSAMPYMDSPILSAEVMQRKRNPQTIQQPQAHSQYQPYSTKTGIASVDDPFSERNVDREVDDAQLRHLAQRLGFSSPQRHDHHHPPPPPPAPPARNDSVLEENKMLKKVVKEMREDIELLRQQQQQQQQQAVQVPTLPAPKATSPPSAQPVSQPAASITKAIDEAALEEKDQVIARLKMERKKLMDTGNELRSALLKAQHQNVVETQQSLEQLREENLGAVFQWIQGENDRGRGRSRSGGPDYFSHLRGTSREHSSAGNVRIPSTKPQHLSGYESKRRLESDEEYDEGDNQDENDHYQDSGYEEAPSPRRPVSSRQKNHSHEAPFRTLQEGDIAVVGNAVSSSKGNQRRNVPQSATVASDNDYSSSASSRPAGQQQFVVRQAPFSIRNASSGSRDAGYVDGHGKRKGVPNPPVPVANTNRTTLSQAQALQKLKLNQQRQKQRQEEQQEEAIAQAKSRVPNYAQMYREENA